MLTNTSFAAKTIPEIIDYARPIQASQLFFTWNREHISSRWRTVQDDGWRQLSPRAFSGNSPSLTALLGGQQMFFASLPSSIEFIRTGKLRGLGVTSAMRSEVVQDIPTIGESVPGYEVSAWYGMGAPKGTPTEIVDKLNKEINAGLDDPKLKARIADLGGTVFALSPADFGKFIAGLAASLRATAKHLA
jgi:tripartite-type tricarboxylate transporter receptor subunit TctC